MRKGTKHIWSHLARYALVPLLVLSFLAPPAFMVEQASAGDTGSVSQGAGQVAGAIGACLAEWLGMAAGNLGLNLSDWVTPTNVPASQSGSGGSISESGNQGGSNENVIKECAWDTLLWALVNMMIEMMLQSVIDWINNDFAGGPMFITDPAAFFLNVGDIIAGEFIFGSDLAVLCSPFYLDVQLALLLRFFEGDRQKFNCRLSDVINNVENFFRGSFVEGGWDGWFNAMLHTESNPYGSMIVAEEAMTARIVSRTGELRMNLDWGNGFLGKLAKEANKWVTPGKVVNAQLEKALGAETDRLTTADEINELVGALLRYFMRQLLGPNGLLGLSAQTQSYNGRLYSPTDILGSSGQTRKEDLLTFVNALIAQAQADPAQADKLAELQALRANVAALDPLAQNFTNTLLQYQSKASQIGTAMGMTDLNSIGQDFIDQHTGPGGGTPGGGGTPSEGVPPPPADDNGGGDPPSGDPAAPTTS